MKTAVEHLNRALKDLLAQRDELDRQIAILERTVSDLGGSPGIELPTGRQTVREIAISMAEEGGFITPTEVVEESERRGNPAKYESVSSILSRMHREGALEKGAKRGTYFLPGRSEPIEERPAADPEPSREHEETRDDDAPPWAPQN